MSWSCRSKTLLTTILCILSLQIHLAQAVSEAQKEKYPEFASLLGGFGYEWEPYEVKTEDGWHLTIFRVLP